MPEKRLGHQITPNPLVALPSPYPISFVLDLTIYYFRIKLLLKWSCYKSVVVTHVQEFQKFLFWEP